MSPAKRKADLNETEEGGVGEPVAKKEKPALKAKAAPKAKAPAKEKAPPKSKPVKEPVGPLEREVGIGGRMGREERAELTFPSSGLSLAASSTLSQRASLPREDLHQQGVARRV